MTQEGLDIRLVDMPLDFAAAIRAVTCPEAGGIDVFVGTTRAETHPELGPLLRLEYEAYADMAVGQIGKLADEAKRRWPVARIVMWHRLGTVAVAEASVVIAVSCPHRGDAFAACRFLIDGLKQSVPIWKKEVYAKNARWQGQK